MATSEFASFSTECGAYFFRKSKVNYFGIAEHYKGKDNHHFSVRIDHASNDATSDAFQVIMNGTQEFEYFRDQMLDDQSTASTEEANRIHDRLLQQDTPAGPEEKPEFVTRDCLEITDGAEEFFKWLHGKYFNAEKLEGWSFKAISGVQDEDFIVCHKPNTSTSPADIHISFKGHCTYAMVCGIVVNDHYTMDNVGFNIILSEFFRDILIPYAGNHKITYNYSGTPNGQPPKDNGQSEIHPGQPQDTRPSHDDDSPGVPTVKASGTLDGLRVVLAASNFYSYLRGKAGLPIENKWNVIQTSVSKFACTYDDGLESLSVGIGFTSNASFASINWISSKAFDISNADHSGPANIIDGDRVSAAIKEQYNRFLAKFVLEFMVPYAQHNLVKFEYPRPGTAMVIPEDTTR